MVWKDKQDMKNLTDMHRPLTEGNLVTDRGKFKNLSLLQTTTSTGAMLTKGIEWLFN